MNIYITKENEEKLRLLKDKSMSGLINHLLDEYFNLETFEAMDKKELTDKLFSPDKKKPKYTKFSSTKHSNFLDKKKGTFKK